MSFDLNALMKQAQEMQAQMEQMQEEASKETAEASSGGGMVTVVATAGGEIKELRIDPKVIVLLAGTNNVVGRIPPGGVDGVVPAPLDEDPAGALVAVVLSAGTVVADAAPGSEALGLASLGMLAGLGTSWVPETKATVMAMPSRMWIFLASVSVVLDVPLASGHTRICTVPARLPQLLPFLYSLPPG